jgi:hypothetical protein
MHPDTQRLEQHMTLARVAGEHDKLSRSAFLQGAYQEVNMALCRSDAAMYMKYNTQLAEVCRQHVPTWPRTARAAGTERSCYGGGQRCGFSRLMCNECKDSDGRHMSLRVCACHIRHALLHASEFPQATSTACTCG